MRLKEFAQNDVILHTVMETASGGATGAGGIASVPNAMGTVIRRMPTTPNLFGWVPPARPKTKKKRKTNR